jgi:hypothetical protein
MTKDIYQLKIVYTDAGNRVERMPYRIIQFHKDTNLQQMASYILKSFSFKMSEPFGFYSNPDNWTKSDHKFELFEDDPKKNTLKNTFIDDIFEIQKEFLLIYDYLEEYRFLIFFDKMVPERNGISYPDTIESMGETKQDDETKLMDEDDDEPKYGAKKKTGGFKDEFDDYDDDDVEKLGGREGGDGEDDDDFGDSGDDDYGFDEFSDGGLEDDYK